MADGFLGRWSRRKLDARDGKPPAPEPVEPKAVPAPPSANTAGGQARATVPSVAEAGKGTATPEAVEPSLPTLDDVRKLTPDSDFSAFTRRGVDPEVRNAAMKKLFTDPHYNVMDGLDIYIDDYSKPDPMPQTMLRQLASARFLNLFEDEEKKEANAATQNEPVPDPSPLPEPASAGSGAEALPRDVADDPLSGPVTQSGSDRPTDALANRTNPDHADPDLRLQ